MSSQFQLLSQRRFRPFFWTQFLGAFNDNLFKTALITLVAFGAGHLTHWDGAMLATLLPGVFILPFFLFSATSGQIADKFDKAVLMRRIKLFEIGIMLIAAWGFIGQHFWLLVAALFLMGTHSTLFGPVKYAYLPQHLQPNELVGGNGLVEMGTFVAILLGEVFGAWFISSSVGSGLIAGAVLLVAVLGYWQSRQIPVSVAADPGLQIQWEPLGATWRNLNFAYRQPGLWLALIAISWFWFYGATLLAQFPNLAQQQLQGDESLFILLLAVFSVGIGIGSLWCEKLSGQQLELGLVPVGALGLSLFGLDLFWAIQQFSSASAQTWLSFIGELSHWRILLDIGLIGICGGLYIVPLYTLIQTRSQKSHQSRIIAANNILNALFMVISAGLSWLLLHWLQVSELVLCVALLNLLMLGYLSWRWPELPNRARVWLKRARTSR